MSYTNTTTHFQWPLPEETDFFNGLDDNQMKEDLDEKIYNLEQQSTGDHEAVTQLNNRVTEVEQTVGGYDAQIEQLEGTVEEHAERLINLTNRQTELSRRLTGKAGESVIAAEYNADDVYIVGDFVFYNNVLYKCKVASASPAGEFNADNWDIAILTDELGGSAPGSIAASGVSFNDAVAQLGASDVQGAINALKIILDGIGGGSMVSLNYAQPLHSFTTGNLSFTADKECYLSGSIPSGCSVSVDGTPISVCTIGISQANAGAISSSQTVPIPDRKLKAGNVVTVSTAATSLHVLEIAQ